MAKGEDDKRPIIIIKRVKKVEGGHHGGAWKVAYADFVTAMMAFFLLLWLLNVTTDEQKAMISSYFAPADPRISESTSGSGGTMGGRTVSEEGAMPEDAQPAVAAQDEPSDGVGKEDGEDGNNSRDAEEQRIIEEMDRVDSKAFEETRDKIEQAIESVPELQALKENLIMDMTPEGLRIQIVDQEGKPMFEVGSAKPLPQAVRLLQLIGNVVRDLPNKISIRGHTDSKPYGKDAFYTNWELSSDRANASRRVMLAGDLTGRLPVERIENVQGKADREPLVPNDPESARNRRISIILLKQSLVPGIKKERKTPTGPKKPELKKREEGVIHFP